jgi:hypothetical protein
MSYRKSQEKLRPDANKVAVVWRATRRPHRLLYASPRGFGLAKIR